LSAYEKLVKKHEKSRYSNFGTYEKLYIWYTVTTIWWRIALVSSRRNHSPFSVPPQLKSHMKVLLVRVIAFVVVLDAPLGY
jgi:hypothetical protein